MECKSTFSSEVFQIPVLKGSRSAIQHDLAENYHWLLPIFILHVVAHEPTASYSVILVMPLQVRLQVSLVHYLNFYDFITAVQSHDMQPACL